MAAAAICGDSSQAERRIEHARRDRHAGGVVDEGEEQVLADVAHHRARQPPRPDQALQVAPEQGDAGALDGHVGARAHGDADVGGGQRRRVVDAVAGHGHAAALGRAASRPPRPCPAAAPRPRPRRCPACRRRPAAVVRLSPVIITSRTPSACSARDRLRRRRLDRVGDGRGRRPAGRRWRRRSPVAPSARSASASASSAAVSTPCSPSGTRPTRAAGRGRRPRRSRPCRPGSRSLTARTASGPRSWAARTMASASGCSLPRSRLAARRSSSASS